MKRLTAYIAGAVFAVLLSGCVALPPDGGPSRAHYIFDFIADNSDYVYNGEPLPTVVRDTELTYQYGRSRVIAGTYWGPNNTIYLIDSADFGVEIHEYVHYLQTMSGELVEGETCTGLIEPAAYQIEDKWLDLIDSDAPRSDLLWLIMMESACWSGFGGRNGH